jgi:hypothetical protein
MNVNLAEKLFSSNLNFIELNLLSVSSAKKRFREYQEAGVIKKNCSFEDSVWQTTNEYANVGLYFNFNQFAYKRYEDVFMLSYASFVDYTKAYCISIFGKNVLTSIEDTLLDIKHLMEKDYEDICGEMADLRLYSANRLSDFLSLLATDNNSAKVDHLMGALDAYSDMHYCSGKRPEQRELADFDSYFDFDDIIKDYWKSNISKEERLFYYPLYIWWILTCVIPLRPREFLLTERECLYKDAEGKYFLKLKRNQIKGRRTGEMSHKISDVYATVHQPIPNYLGKLIETYIDETSEYANTELNTLFLTDPHYQKWGQAKHADSRFLTYMNMNTILRYFFKEIVQDRYGYTVRYDHGDVDHENKEIQFIHLGDTRHIAFINLMQEGATPVTAMLLGGHSSIEMASHYYSNVITFIECKTYRQYRKLTSGDIRYQISHTKKLPPVSASVALPDGGHCYSEKYKNCSVDDCLMASGPNGEIGYCPECVFYRRNGLSYFSGDNLHKRRIEQDCKLLLFAVQAVMEGKGNTENIQEAMLRLNSSKYSYKAYLEQKIIRETEDS